MPDIIFEFSWQCRYSSPTYKQERVFYLSPSFLLQCSRSCGGGVQRRTVDCRNTIAQTAAVSCPRCVQPQSSRPCNEHECPVEGEQVVTRFSRAFLKLILSSLFWTMHVVYTTSKQYCVDCLFQKSSGGLKCNALQSCKDCYEIRKFLIVKRIV